METRMEDLLDELNLDEIDKLLSEEIHFTMDPKIASRIKSSVFRKVGIKKFFPWHGYSKRLMAASVIFMMLAVTSLAGGFHYYQTPVAYVDIDINPSIEIGVNRWDKIVSAKGYNDEGKDILKSKSILNKNLDEGVKKIIEIANEQGFLSRPGGSAVSIALVDNESEEAKRLTEMCEENVKEYAKEENLNVEVVTAQITLERKEEAEKLGITPGKLNLIQKLQALDGAIEVENYKHTAVSEILKEIKQLKQDKDDESDLDGIKDNKEDSQEKDDRESRKKESKEKEQQIKDGKAKDSSIQASETKEIKDNEAKENPKSNVNDNKGLTSKTEEGKKNSKDTGKQWKDRMVQAEAEEQLGSKAIIKQDNKSEEKSKDIKVDEKTKNNGNKNDKSEKNQEDLEVIKQEKEEKIQKTEEDKMLDNNSANKETQKADNDKGHKK